MVHGTIFYKTQTSQFHGSIRRATKASDLCHFDEILFSNGGPHFTNIGLTSIRGIWNHYRSLAKKKFRTLKISQTFSKFSISEMVFLVTPNPNEKMEYLMQYDSKICYK